MKNIHVLPTDKPSRLLKRESDSRLILYNRLQNNREFVHLRTQNICITNNEEIKEGDWCICLGLTYKYFKVIDIDSYKLYYDSREYFNKNVCKKIILTTDLDLIADGVQAIDNEFLKWFVKNPSCEEVEVKFETLWLNKRFGGTWQPFPDEQANERKTNYKIIIPKEEPITLPDVNWQSDITNKVWDEDKEPKQEYESECICEGGCRGFVNVKCKKPKQETIEQTSIMYYPAYPDGIITTEIYALREGFVKGFKVAQERSYSKEEVNEIISASWIACEDNEGETFTQARARILEQFKKKQDEKNTIL